MAAKARKRRREEAALEAPDEPVFVKQPGAFLECPICHEVAAIPSPLRSYQPVNLCFLYQLLSEASVLRCGHTFCSHCIVSSLRLKLECPMCRAAQPDDQRYCPLLGFCVNQSLRCGQVGGHRGAQPFVARGSRRSGSALSLGSAAVGSRR